MADLLSRTTYRQVVKKLEHYRKQFEEDRRENPGLIVPAYGILLRKMIESTVRANHERCYKGLADAVLEYFVEKGLLVRYCGDYTFPGEKLPTEIKAEALKLIGGHPNDK